MISPKIISGACARLKEDIYYDLEQFAVAINGTQTNLII